MNAYWRAPAGLHTASARLPDEGELPSFDGATGWLNSPPLTPAGLRGKVVLVDFWTYTCINWLRQLPYLRAWAEKYSLPQALRRPRGLPPAAPGRRVTPKLRGRPDPIFGCREPCWPSNDSSAVPGLICDLLGVT
jgi:hypothetical protein